MNTPVAALRLPAPLQGTDTCCLDCFFTPPCKLRLLPLAGGDACSLAKPALRRLLE